MITAGLFTTADVTDPDDLRRRLSQADPEGRLAPIGLRDIVIGTDALSALPRLVSALATDGDVVVIQDATPMRRAGKDLKASVAGLLWEATDRRVRVETIGQPGELLHADAAALAETDAAVRGAGCVVAVGSGTITDLAKDATHRAKDLPFVVVQTAVSVNAFSDDMAVLLRDGVKRTVPSRWPDALVVDRDVVVDAPPVMNRAGYGELASMFTAPADWYLASVAGADSSFHPAAVGLVRDHADAYLAAADGVGRADGEAILELARIMTLSGIALGVARRTAPMSGTEHLVSHLLDMRAAAEGRETAFHGAQVGVASVVMALAWQRLLRELDPDRLRRGAAALHPHGDGMRNDVLAAFSSLDRTGAAAAECWREYDAKRRTMFRQRARLEHLADTWDEHRQQLGEILVEPARLAEALGRAGAPLRFRDLKPSVDAETARWAIRNCFLMRDRLTLADVAHLAGSWDDAFVERVLDDAAALGAGL
ncbi:MAG TPA: iron-containing alcohol dehydrogenase [candidate division Zixibacteria bacterium]|nr:iron-containing alcohol dehydrogenase [candidate division Zixibacteria bacterium]